MNMDFTFNFSTGVVEFCFFLHICLEKMSDPKYPWRTPKAVKPFRPQKARWPGGKLEKDQKHMGSMMEQRLRLDLATILIVRTLESERKPFKCG